MEREQIASLMARLARAAIAYICAERAGTPGAISVLPIQSVHWIGNTEIAPGVPARSAQMYAIAARAKRAINDAICSRSIKTQKGIDAIDPLTSCQQISYAA